MVNLISIEQTTILIIAIKNNSNNNNNKNNNNRDATQDSSDSNGRSSGWSRAHILMNQTKASTDFKQAILLDNQSNINIFGNPNLVYNKRKATKLLELSTNRGISTTYEKGNIPDFRKHSSILKAS